MSGPSLHRMLEVTVGRLSRIEERFAYALSDDDRAALEQVRRTLLTIDPVRHGASYSSGCRCDLCRSKATSDHLKGTKLRSERLKVDPSLAPHGTVSTYRNWGCRCEPCTEANSIECARYRAQRKSTAP